MAEQVSTRKGKKNQSKRSRKSDRNREFCEGYARSNRREKNKVLKLKKHLKRYPDDTAAKNTLEKLGG